MTNYNLKPIIPPSLVAQEKKEKRRRVLEAVWERRKEWQKRYNERMKQAFNSNEEYQEYIDYSG